MAGELSKFSASSTKSGDVFTIAGSIGSSKRLSASALLCANILLNCNVYSNSERQSSQHLILAEATHHLEVEPSQFIISQSSPEPSQFFAQQGLTITVHPPLVRVFWNSSVT